MNVSRTEEIVLRMLAEEPDVAHYGPDLTRRSKGALKTGTTHVMLRRLQGKLMVESSQSTRAPRYRMWAITQRGIETLKRLKTPDLPRPMAAAPRDGTVVLVFVEGTDYGQPLRYGAPRSYSLRHRPPGWRMAWDDTAMRESDLLGWLPIPTYIGKALT